MACNNYNSAVITPVLAAGVTAPPYFYQVNISQKLCSSTCAGLTPVFNPSFKVVGVSNVGTNQYMATIAIEGVISYVPCKGTPCCTKSQLLSQTFSVPFYSINTPTSVTVTAGTPVNSIAVSPCQSCSRNFVCETPISLNVA